MTDEERKNSRLFYCYNTKQLLKKSKAIISLQQCENVENSANKNWKIFDWEWDKWAIK